MAVWGTLDMIEQQLAVTPRFRVALDYLRTALAPGSPEHTRILAVPEGETRRVELAEGVFALEQVYVAKPRDQGRFEAHDRHVDLQAVVVGEEVMEVALRSGLTPTEDLLAERDLVFLEEAATRSDWRVKAGEIAVFFPADAHKPSLAAGAPSRVVKTVVKVRL